MPGGSGRPPVTSDIFSCMRVSTLDLASALAATIRSSRISDFVRLQQARVDLDAFDLALAAHDDGDETGARLALDLDGAKLLLKLLHAGLHANAEGVVFYPN